MLRFRLCGLQAHGLWIAAASKRLMGWSVGFRVCKSKVLGGLWLLGLGC